MPQEIHIGAQERFPGNTLQARLYKRALNIPLFFPATHVAGYFKNNGWSNSWDAGIFTYHHYHSITHEVLGIYSGRATIQLGGETGPRFRLEKGDVLFIPAGVAHKNLNAENDVGVVGAYPNGMDYDIKRGYPGEQPQADQNIATVPLPVRDPVTGAAWS